MWYLYVYAVSLVLSLGLYVYGLYELAKEEQVSLKTFVLYMCKTDRFFLFFFGSFCFVPVANTILAVSFTVARIKEWNT